MRGLAYKLGLRLSRIAFVRSAIDEKADLSGFDHRPTFKLIFGLFLILISNTLCWPTITGITGYSIYHRRPWIAAMGGPAVYAISFIANGVGMAMAGAKYARLFFRWLSRVAVERLLAFKTPGVHPRLESRD